jgi:hypothetical protein
MTPINAPTTSASAATTDQVATLDFATAQSTYRIIQALLNHLEASADLIALLASRLGPEPTQQVTQSAAWATYLTARRELDQVKPELEKFVTTVSQLLETATVADQPATTEEAASISAAPPLE